MMYNLRAIPFVVILLAAATARAGMIAPPLEIARQASAVDTTPASQSELRATSIAPAQQLPLDLHWLEQPFAPSRPADATTGSAPGSANANITALPPTPSSTVLALSGLLSLGAIQLGRNVRKLHFSAIPEWYHAGAVQVGHSTPFDLDFDVNLAALPVCVYSQPDPPQDPLRSCARWPASACCGPQFQSPTTSPRAPPQDS